MLGVRSEMPNRTQTHLQVFVLHAGRGRTLLSGGKPHPDTLNQILSAFLQMVKYTHMDIKAHIHTLTPTNKNTQKHTCPQIRGYKKTNKRIHYFKQLTVHWHYSICKLDTECLIDAEGWTLDIISVFWQSINIKHCQTQCFICCMQEAFRWLEPAWPLRPNVGITSPIHLLAPHLLCVYTWKCILECSNHSPNLNTGGIWGRFNLLSGKWTQNMHSFSETAKGAYYVLRSVMPS